MPKRAAIERLLERVSRICLAFPEAAHAPCDQHADFRVRGKVFVYFLNDHHGDGIVSVCARAPLGENAERAARDPARFYLPAYIAPRGWVGMRLDVGAVDWDEIDALVEESYRLVAPRKLLRELSAKRVSVPPVQKTTSRN